MDNTPDNQCLLVARQPIFDQHQKVVAYELLYRPDDQGAGAARLEGADDNGEIILNVYTSISDAGSVRRVPAFVPVSRELLLSGYFPDLPSKQVVIELTPGTEPDPAYEQAALKLVKDGYRLALCNFRYHSSQDTLLRAAQIVKLDVRQFSQSELDQQLHLMQPFKVAFLSEGIDNFTQLERCIDMGFKLYQGSFLSKPKLVKERRVSAKQFTLLQLIQELQKPATTPDKLEALIIRDPVLTFKLLRIVNSAAYALVRKVESIAQAVVLLGLEQVKKWATLISMSANKDKPEELSRVLLIRGRMCELVAVTQRLPGSSSSYFMAGMMSGLHAMLDIERDAMLNQVPLGDDVKAAIRNGEGPMGEVLTHVINYESGDWDRLPADFDGALYDWAYRASLQWTQESMQAMYDD
jgi:EAL and modified HD-GYP domain-containing signal transduction protein